MNDLFVFAAHNTIVSLCLALFVFGLTRVWKNPPVAHILWLLVLLKLVSPPVMRVDWMLFLPYGSASADKNTELADERNGVPSSTFVAHQPRLPFEAHQLADDKDRLETEFDFGRNSAPRKVSESTTSELTVTYAAKLSNVWSLARPTLFWLWLGGAAAFALIAAIRIRRFERLLQDTLPGSERWQRLVREVADRIGIRRIPQICCVECVEVPFIWWAGGRPKLVLPMCLLKQLDDQSMAMVVAHELAHLRRRDHWVRGIEMVVSVLYWWNPLVPVIRRQIHQTEDVCCDAWVRWMYPESVEHYAEVVLNTAELLSVPGVDVRPLLASPFIHTFSLKERIEMILNGHFAPRISAGSTCIIAFLALMLWPSFMQTVKTPTLVAASDDAVAQSDKPNAAVNSRFPHVVNFEQGATRFENGDQITVLEVQGTAETFTQGNIYWIKGTYTLASRDKAVLAAYITAMEAVNGISSGFKVQSTVVNKGEGAFTLYLPMTCKGWPHVSFYPANGGDSFGGNYFGVGDTVLKEWWGSGVDSPIQEIEKLGGRIERDESLMGAVVSVDFGGSQTFKDDDIKRLQPFKSLTTVGLGHTTITDTGLENLAELEKIRMLSKLYLRSSKISEAESKVLKELRELTTLYIDNTQITDSGVKALKSLQKLRTLGLGHTQLSDAGLTTVAQLTGLTHLYIDNTQVTDAGLKELKSLKALTTLGLGHTRTTDAGLKTVAQFTGMTHLYIDNTQVTDAGLEGIRTLKRLQTLGLGHTQITDAGLKSLRDFQELTTLYLDHTQVTDAGIQELKKSLPNLNIIN